MKLLILYLSAMLLCSPCKAQSVIGGGNAVPFSGAPSGACLSLQNAVDTTTGNFYSCVGGAWIKVGPGGNPGVLVSPVITPNPLNLQVNVGFKGPNPEVDATQFGVRAVLPNSAPAIPGITANCIRGSANVTISAASTFQNGDGVALYGCGSGTIAAPAAPTLTPAVAAAQTGTLLYVAGPTGSTTYCYQLVARKLLGATNVSPEICTTIGPATLGLQTNVISTVTLSNNVATYITSSPHGLVAGAHIVITGVATLAAGGSGGNGGNTPFNCWCLVSTVSDNTHFTVALLSDSRNGAITAGTGGLVNYWNSIHIKATETANNFQYYIYGRVSGGSKTLIGTMWPQNSDFLGTAGYLEFDDFGSPVSTFPNPPPYIPATVPTAATNDMLSTTIASGGGTTSLVLANAAGNTINTQTILFDDAITFLSAANYAANQGAGTNGPLMLPETGTTALSYVFNSPISLGTGTTSRITVLQKGGLIINEPIILSFVSWYGQPTSNLSCASFGFSCTSTINIGTASPGIYALTNNFFFNVGFGMLSTNGSTAFVQDNGGVPVSAKFSNVSFGLSSSTSYSNMGAMFRRGAGYFFSDTLLGGSQNGNLIATTPGMYFQFAAGNAVFNNLNLSGVGIATMVGGPGGYIKADGVYSQGNYEPYFSVVNSGGVFFVDARNVTFDSTAVPFLANYGGGPVTLELTNSIASAQVATGSASGLPRTTINITGTLTGQIPQTNIAELNNLYFTNDGTLGRTYISTDILNRNVALGPGNSIFSTTSLPAAPSCVVSAGGAVPVGSFTYQYTPYFPNGSEGTGSLVCNVTTTAGNQTVTLNWAAVPGVTQYQIYRGGTTVLCSPTTGTSFVDTTASPCGQPGPSFAAGGPAGMRGGLLWGQTVQVGDRATITSGAGAPSAGLCTTSTGGKLYLRTDGTTTTTLYVCDGSTGTWTPK
jgi:hypothetical protein